MTKRRLLQTQIISAWHQCIEEDYCNQRINSERSLQASFWSHINERLPRTRRLFIEPSLSIQSRSGLKKIIPDIVVCNTREVIAVVELKYLPRGQPKHQKDIDSLATIARYRHRIHIANDRFRGSEKDATVYSLSKSILFVWAGVHAQEKPDQETLFSAGKQSLSECYMQLHAVTHKDGKPKVFQRR